MTATARSRRRADTRSTPFPSTSRWLRGRILDRLRDAPDDAWVAFEDPIGAHSLPAVLEEVQRMSIEGLFETDSATQRARLVSSR